MSEKRHTAAQILQRERVTALYGNAWEVWIGDQWRGTFPTEHEARQRIAELNVRRLSGSPPDDITRIHEKRGNVRCELCSAWCYGIPTLDDCYLCQSCHDESVKSAARRPSPEQEAERP